MLANFLCEHAGAGLVFVPVRQQSTIFVAAMGADSGWPHLRGRRPSRIQLVLVLNRRHVRSELRKHRWLHNLQRVDWSRLSCGGEREPTVQPRILFHRIWHLQPRALFAISFTATVTAISPDPTVGGDHTELHNVQ